MGSNLHWQPVAAKTKAAPGDDHLKLLIQHRYGLSSRRDPITLTAPNEFIEGLAAARVDGAKQLLDLLAKHGEIEIWEER